MSNQGTKVIGSDLGFGFVKTYMEGPCANLFPSVIGENVTQIDIGKMSSLTGPRSFVFSNGESTYLVGESAVVQSRASIGAIDESKFADRETVLVYTLTSIGQMLLQTQRPERTFELVGGMPISRFVNYAEKLRAILEGTHKFNLNGTDFTVSIPKAILIPSPFAPYFDYVLNEHGEAIDNHVFDSVCVVSMGTYTTEFTKIVGGLEPQYVDHASESLHVGWRAVTEEIRAWLQREKNLSTSHYVIDRAIMDGKDRIANVDFSEVKNRAISTVARQIAGAMGTYFGNGNDVDRVVATGGPSKFLSPAVQAQYRHNNYISLNDAVYATARGYFKFGIAS